MFIIWLINSRIITTDNIENTTLYKSLQNNIYETRVPTSITENNYLSTKVDPHNVQLPIGTILQISDVKVITSYLDGKSLHIQIHILDENEGLNKYNLSLHTHEFFNYDTKYLADKSAITHNSNLRLKV